jgi:hypothetical protein
MSQDPKLVPKVDNGRDHYSLRVLPEYPESNTYKALAPKRNKNEPQETPSSGYQK